jgi:hypothetical protein
LFKHELVPPELTSVTVPIVNIVRDEISTM